jgi:hypothetical protein
MVQNKSKTPKQTPTAKSTKQQNQPNREIKRITNHSQTNRETSKPRTTHKSLKNPEKPQF